MSRVNARPLRIALALVLGLLAASCTAAGDAPAVPGQGATQGGPGLGEQRSEAGAVVIVASWLDGGTPAVNLALDTHSIDLDGFDLKELARARVDNGAWLAPSAWDAPKGGHHRAGTLTFAGLDPEALASARVIELEVRDVAVPSRMLRWERSS